MTRNVQARSSAESGRTSSSSTTSARKTTRQRAASARPTARVPRQRNQIEYEVIREQVIRNKERFIARLNRHLRRDGDCRLWTGCRDANGYSRVNFRYGPTPKGNFLIGVHRLFLILRLGRPIRRGTEAGHYACNHPLCVVHVSEQTRRQNLEERDGRQKAKRNGAVS
jgi:hypothetical protein